MVASLRVRKYRTLKSKKVLFKVRNAFNKTTCDKKLNLKAAKMFMWKLEPEPLFGFTAPRSRSWRIVSVSSTGTYIVKTHLVI